MMMRYRGGGVGHKSTRDATNKFLTDRDTLDIPTTADKDCDTDSDGEEAKITDGASSRENVCAGDEEMEPDPNEDINESEDASDEDRDEAEFEEEFDYGLPGGDGLGSDHEDDEEGDDEDALGPEDGDEEEEDDLGYADL
jgi:hypothetical protein